MFRTFPIFSILLISIFCSQAFASGVEPDFNGDGKVDLIWRNYETGANQIWLMDGTGRTSIVDLPAVTDLKWVIGGTGDFNHDGHTDILWRKQFGKGELKVWLMDGTTKKAEELQITDPPDASWQIAGVGDFNGDLKPDIVFMNSYNQYKVWFMDSGSKTAEAALPVPSAQLGYALKAVGDFNGDGKTDLLLRKLQTLDQGDVVVWLLNGTELIDAENYSLTIDNIKDFDWEIAGAGDFDKDGQLDVLYRNNKDASTMVGLRGKSQVVLSDNHAVKEWRVGNRYIKNLFINRDKDFNGDGKADIVFRNYKTGENKIWFMDGLTKSSEVNLDTVADTRWVISGTGDMNNDGHPDILWRHQFGIGANKVWLMNGTTKTGEMVLDSLPDSGYVMRGTGDFNGDNLADIVWQGLDGKIVFWFMDGNGNKTGEETRYVSSIGPPGYMHELVAIGDHNGDGYSDLIMRCKMHDYHYGTYESYGEAQVLYMGGATKAFMEAWLSKSEENIDKLDEKWWVAGAADYNGDGIGDILYRHKDTGVTTIVCFTYNLIHQIYLSDHTMNGTYKEWGINSRYLPYININKGKDFNGDGHADIVWRNYKTGENKIWLMNGLTKSSEVSLDTVADTKWLIGGTGDFNNDGYPDILWRHQYGTGANKIWLMNGTSKTGEIMLDSLADSGYVMCGTGDFNRDNLTDIVWQREDGKVVFWFMDGNGNKTGEEIKQYTTRNARSMTELAAVSDQNGDGYPDLVFYYRPAYGAGMVGAVKIVHLAGFNTALREQYLVKPGTFYEWWKEFPVKYWEKPRGVPYKADTDWRLTGAGDFNGDGAGDILFKPRAAGDCTIICGNYEYEYCSVKSENIVDQVSDDWGIDHGFPQEDVRFYVKYPGNVEMGTTVNIEWDGTGVSGDISIVMRFFSGTYYKTIAEDLPNTGSYTWNIPEWYSYGEYYLELVNSDHSKSGRTEVFTLYKLFIQSPSNKEFDKTDALPITWVKNGDDTSKVKLDLIHESNGSVIKNIISSTDNDGSFDWTVPADVQNGAYRIRLTYPDSRVVESWIFEFKDKSITVLYPAAGDILLVVGSHKIEWTSDSLNKHVYLELYKGNMKVRDIGGAPALNGYRVWEMPDDLVNGDDYRIRFKETTGPYEHFSDNFTIANGRIRVNSPNGGESYVRGASVKVEWLARGAYGNAAIDLYKGAAKVASLGETELWKSSLNCVIPLDAVAGDDYRIKITAGEYSDFSDETFSITLAQLSSVEPDFNGDGKTDILWRNYVTGANEIWLMNGADFINKVDLPVLSTDWVIGGTGDFNSDGKTDILWRNQKSGGSNLVYLMDGTVKSGELTLPAEADLNWEVAGVTDFNRDGKADILWRNQGSTGANRIWLMNGATKISEVSLDVVTDLKWIIAGTGDFNRDGNADIVWRDQGGSGENKVWYMDGTTHSGGEDYLRVEKDLNWEIGSIGDFNGDGKTDILLKQVGDSGFNFIWYMDGNLKTNSHVIETPVRNEPEWRNGNAFPRSASFNQLPQADIEVVAPVSGLVVQEGDKLNITWNKNGNNDSSVTIEADIFNDEIWNEDQKIVVVTNAPNTGSFEWTVSGIPEYGKAYIFRVVGTETNLRAYSGYVFINASSRKLEVSSPVAGTSVLAGSTVNIEWSSVDITGDVVLELFRGDTEVVDIATVDVSGVSKTWTVPPGLPGADNYRVKIRTLDNTVEAFSSNFTVSGRKLLVVSPNGGETFSAGETISVNWSSAGIEGNVVVDILKNNSRVFVVGENFPASSGECSWTIPEVLEPGGDYKVRVYKNGVAEDSSDTDFTIQTRPQAVKDDDFNGDGKTDILWRNYNTGVNEIWLMNGADFINKVDLSALSTEWVVGGTGDFNNDGKTDIVWRNQKSTGANLVYLMDGTVKSTELALPTETDLNWEIAGVADFNSDGKPDVLWRNQGSTGANRIWLMNGDTLISEITLESKSDLRWIIAGAGDFNNDGYADIVWRDQGGSGENLVWYMEGVSHSRGEDYFRVQRDLSWEIGSIGDFNSDGKADILLRQVGSNGFNFIWYMDGNIKTNSHVIETPVRNEPEWRNGNAFPRSAPFNRLPQAGIEVISPESGVVVQEGGKLNITWNKNGNNDANVTIEAEIFNDEMWNEDQKIVVVASTPNSGSYEWTVSGALDYGKVYIFRVVGVESNIRAYSGYVFINASSKKLELTSPVAGTLAGVGSTLKIEWNSVDITGNVALKLLKEDTGVIDIGTVDVSSGTKDWVVPSGLSGADNYRIQVKTVDNEVEGYSSNFTILDRKLLLVSPNGGETFSIGDTININWGAAGIDGNVAVAILKGNTQIEVLENSFPASSGECSWTIPASVQPAGDYKVSVYKSGVAEDSSDSEFTIQGTPDAIKGNDFNGDGKPDILWRNYETGANEIWLMNGADFISSALQPALSTNWVVGGTGDFNSDGKTDIVWRDQKNTGSNKIWLMNGTEKSSELVLPAETDRNWEIAGVTDFNRDGKADILWRNQGSTGANRIWLMDGAAMLSEVVLETKSDLRWVIEGTGDFNYDGYADIIWREQGGSGENLIWYMDGTSHSKGQDYLRVQPDLRWEIADAADFSGDGKVDILLRMVGGNGYNFIWNMDGNMKVGSSLITTPERREPEWRSGNKFPRTTGFNQLSDADIKITAPDQGITVSVGDRINLAWTTTDKVGDSVNIEVAVFNGELWNESKTTRIASGVPNSGTYEWIAGGELYDGRYYMFRVIGVDTGIKAYSNWIIINRNTE